MFAASLTLFLVQCKCSHDYVDQNGPSIASNHPGELCRAGERSPYWHVQQLHVVVHSVEHIRATESGRRYVLSFSSIPLFLRIVQSNLSARRTVDLVTVMLTTGTVLRTCLAQPFYRICQLEMVGNRVVYIFQASGFILCWILCRC